VPDERSRAGPIQAPRPERQIAFRTGISAESRAAAFLIAKGFRIVARRWRSPVEAWLARYPDDRIRNIRFDAMMVAPGRIPHHIPSAFDASS
jgi:putative endonuclease